MHEKILCVWWINAIYEFFTNEAFNGLPWGIIKITSEEAMG